MHVFFMSRGSKCPYINSHTRTQDMNLVKDKDSVKHFMDK